MRYSMMFLIAAVALIFIAGAVIWYGEMRWSRTTDARLSVLESGHRSPDVRRVSFEELEGLPQPVRRYFETVLEDGQSVITAVRLTQEGMIDMGQEEAKWCSFTAEQRVVTRRPGFLWNARIRMMLVLRARVHDAYVKGEGLLHGSLFGLLTVAEQKGEAADRGELLRYFAEAPWYPTALLPSQGVEWKAVDENSAEAVLEDGNTTARLLFRFNEEHLIESVHAEARGRAVDDEIVPTPWEGYWSDYRREEGMLIPMEGEVAWVLPEGAQSYWKGRITSIEYEAAEQLR